MVRLPRQLGLALLLATGLLLEPAPFLAAQAPATSMAKPAAANSVSASPARVRHSKKKKPMAEEQAPQEPVVPPTLAESPPTPPQVTYRNGQLSIDAHNATLSQTLRAVQQQTGAAIDIPASASSERVVAQLGPGAPHDVLNTLLNGTKFDYIILGVTGDPGAVQRVILTPRQNSPATVAQNNPIQNQEPQDDDASPDEGIAVNEPEPENPPEQQQPMPPGAFRRPGFPGQPGQPPGFSNGNNGEEQNNGVKSPEQLMQELQLMQQQQQQYQQQLNPANQNQQPQ
jgi:hypothetical protein